MATTKKPDNTIAAARSSKLSRKFVPALDLSGADESRLAELSAADKRQIISTKIQDVTHFRVGLSSLGRVKGVALTAAPAAQALPRALVGRLAQPSGEPGASLGVQPLLPSPGGVGAGVLTDEQGRFELPLPVVGDQERAIWIREGITLRITGADGTDEQRVPLPAPGLTVVGTVNLERSLAPLNRSIVGSLIDLVEGLATPPREDTAGVGNPAPVTISLGQDACNISFVEDANVRRFPYRLLVRLVEPRITTVNEVFLPSGQYHVSTGGTNRVMVPISDPKLLGPLNLTDTRFVERVPVDKPISVDGFRDALIGVEGTSISAERTVPMAGTLGLGYVLDLAQVWRYEGLCLGNLLYSLPLAPGEQQRITVVEHTSTASVSEHELVDTSESQRSTYREDASTMAVFESAFHEHVDANAGYQNEASSSSWGAAGGIGFALGPIAIGLGGGGGGGSSSNSGSTNSHLDGVRTYSNSAAESLHRYTERAASARRRGLRTSVRLATQSDTARATTKVITNHNKAHALTLQYWEVLRRFHATTEVEGVKLVCFVPLDLVRFLPAGQRVQLSDTTAVDTRAELLTRYGLLLRHADALRPGLPARHREGLRLAEDFAANPRATVNVSGPASDTLSFSLQGTFLPNERIWVTVRLRNGRQLNPVALDSSLTALPAKTFGTRDEVIEELRKRRGDTSSPTTMTGSVVIPEQLDKSEIVGFTLSRRFDAVNLPLDITKNPMYELFKTLNSFVSFGSMLESTAQISAADLEALLGGPQVRLFSARINTSTTNISTPALSAFQELPPGGLPLAAVEQYETITYRELLKIERTLQHVISNTLKYSKAVWSSLTPEERVVMLEGYTIGLPAGGLSPEDFTDASQHVPLLNCVANQVLGYYGNCMIMPFSIPATLAAALAREAAGDGDDDTTPLTTGAVQDALTAYHKTAFSPPVSRFTLPTRGVLGEAVLGHCPSAEKIDLTRFWNWRDSPGESVADISAADLRPLSQAGTLTAPSQMAALPSIINNVAGEGSTSLGRLAEALAGKGPTASDFSTDFLLQDTLKTLGAKTIETAESARADALGRATGMADKAMAAAVDMYKSAQGSRDKAAERQETAARAEAERTTARETAAQTRQENAVRDLRDNAAAYLGVATARGAGAQAYATSIIQELAGGALPLNRASKLFASYDVKVDGDPTTRTPASTAWLTALGLI